MSTFISRSCAITKSVHSHLPNPVPYILVYKELCYCSFSTTTVFLEDFTLPWTAVAVSVRRPFVCLAKEGERTRWDPKEQEQGSERPE